MTPATVLLVSEMEVDSHLLPVTLELTQRGHDVRIFNPGAFSQNATVVVDGTAAGQRVFLAWADQMLDLDTVQAAWYRRPGDFQLDPALAPEEATWLREQWRDLVQGIWAGTDAFWVSEPHRIRHANLKLRQLRLAHQLGFRTPDYTVTNDPDRARSFVAAYPGGVVVKALANPTLFSPARAGMIYTHRLSPEDRDLLDAVTHEPAFFQSLVHKHMDVRVTVFGETVFAVGIDSMSTPIAVVDFRRADIMDLPHHPLTLPPTLQAACVSLVRTLGLQYGAIDLVLTPDEEYVFLEINPNGQWYWIEMVTGLPMTQALCELLERGIGLSPSRPQPKVRALQTVPVGEQVVPLSSEPTGKVHGSAPENLVNLAATRVWFETTRGQMLLHVGDVERSDTGDNPDASIVTS